MSLWQSAKNPTYTEGVPAAVENKLEKHLVPKVRRAEPSHTVPYHTVKTWHCVIVIEKNGEVEPTGINQSMRTVVPVIKRNSVGWSNERGRNIILYCCGNKHYADFTKTTGKH